MSDNSNDDSNQVQKQARKRNRITLVCNVCKFRKVKCDRGQPCSSCTKYNTSHICAYNKPYYGDASVDVVNVEPDVSQKNSLSESSSVNSAQTASGIVDSPNSGPSSTSTSSTSVSAISANQPASSSVFSKVITSATAQDTTSSNLFNRNAVPTHLESHDRLSNSNTSAFKPDYQTPRRITSKQNLQAQHPQLGLQQPQQALGQQPLAQQPSSQQPLSQQPLDQQPQALRHQNTTLPTPQRPPPQLTHVPQQDARLRRVHSSVSSESYKSSERPYKSSISSTGSYSTTSPVVTGRSPHGLNNINSVDQSLNKLSEVQSNDSDKGSQQFTSPSYASATTHASTGPTSVSSTTHLDYKEPNLTPNSRVYLVAKQYVDIMKHFQDYKSVIGINPVSSPSDTINFFDYPPISTTPDKYEVNHGPFTWHAFLKMDMGLSDLWAFMSTKSQSFHEAKTKFMDCVPPGKNKESSRSFENQSVLNKTPIQVLQRLNIAAKKKFNTSKHNINEGIPLGLNFITDHEYLNNNDIELSSKILTVLPSKRIVWIHINRFFKFIYPYIPFLDETSFKKSIEAIIGPESFTEEKIEGLKIEDNIDYAKLGIMLIILRMSYLSLITNNQEVNEFFLGYDGQKRNTFYKEKQKLTDSELRSLKMLLLNSIGIDVIVLARNCLNKFQLFQKMNLSILQLALFMRIYVFIAPEDSEGPDRNQFQIYNGTLLSMAYSIGLNREPDSFKSVLNDPKENNIRRKIWFHLNYIDLLHGFSSGNPLTTNPIASDVKFPFHEDGNENISFEALDSYTHVAWKFLQPLSTKMRNILNIVGNVSEGVKIIELVEALNDFEIFVATNLGTHISEFIDAFKEDFFNDNFRRVLQVHYYIQVKFFMVSIYHHLFIHYETEKNQELSFFYLKKMLMVLTEEFLPSYYTILEHEHYYFSYSANLFLNPVIESAMHKSNGILFSLIIRMSYTIRAMEGANPSAHVEKMATDESYKSYFDDMSQLQYYLTKCAKLGTLGISKLGNRYLYAWRISKSNLFILRAISSDEFYSGYDFVNYCKQNDPAEHVPSCDEYDPRKFDTLTGFNLPHSLVKELCFTIESSLQRLGGSQLLKEWIALYGPVPEGDPKAQRYRNSIKRRKLDEDNVKEDRQTQQQQQPHVQKQPQQQQVPSVNMNIPTQPLAPIQNPIPNSQLNGLLNENYGTPKFSPGSLIPMDQNMDDIFSKITNRPDNNSFNLPTYNFPSVSSTPNVTFESEPNLITIQDNFENAMENYYALDDPYFEIFNESTLNQLIDTFDQQK